MQVKTGVKYALYSDLKNGGMQTAQIDFNLAEVIFLSGDRISLSSQYLFESLKRTSIFSRILSFLQMIIISGVIPYFLLQQKEEISGWLQKWDLALFIQETAMTG